MIIMKYFKSLSLNKYWQNAREVLDPELSTE